MLLENEQRESAAAENSDTFLGYLILFSLNEILRNLTSRYGLQGNACQFSEPFVLKVGPSIASVIPFSLCCLTILGNTFVILVVCLNQRLSRKQTSVLIVNLALADLMVGVGVMPIASILVVTEGRWIFGRYVCRIWTSLDVICSTASILTLCIISVDRFIGVTRPLQYNVVVTRARLVVATGFVWFTSLTRLFIGIFSHWKIF